VLRTPFVLAEELFPTGSFLERANLLSVLPLFLFCLLAGLAIQAIIDARFTDRRSGRSFVDRPTMERISNSAQDVLIVVAISRLGRNGLPPGVHGLGHFLHVVYERGRPFILTCAAGIAWGVVSFWYVAPRLLPDFWAERALVEFGVSIGATSTGLLLLRMADPEGKTPVLRDFTFKQIFHVLITGGGFFDVLVPIPLCSATRSAWPLLIVCLIVIAVLLAAHPGATRQVQLLRGRPGGRESSTRQLRSSPRGVHAERCTANTNGAGCSESTSSVNGRKGGENVSAATIPL
jgi:Na+/glutamate symporter